MGYVFNEIPSWEDVEAYRAFSVKNFNKFLTNPYIAEKNKKMNEAINRVCEHYRCGADYSSFEDEDHLKHWREAVKIKNEILLEVSNLIIQKENAVRTNIALGISFLAIIVSILNWK